jgi:hypothetical protein
MNKAKFSLVKAQKAVEISSRIEGHKIPQKKAISQKGTKIKAKN